MKNLRLRNKVLSLATLSALVFTNSAIAENRIKTFDVDTEASNYSAYSEYDTDFKDYIPYTLNIADYSNFTDMEYNYFQIIVNGILKHEAVVKRPYNITDESVVKVDKCLKDSEYWSIIKNMIYNRDTDETTIVYRYDKKTSIQVLNTIHRYMQFIIDELIEPDMNDLDILMTIYGYTVEHFKYDYNYDKDKSFLVPSQLDPNRNVQMYETIYNLQENNLGVCHTFSYFINYACNMLGVKTSVVRGTCKAGYHMWLIAEIDGYNYFFDPTFEMGHKTKLKYFGMTLEERNKDKADEKEYLTDNYPYDVELCHEKTFKDLRKATYYEYIGNHVFIVKFGKKVRFFDTINKKLTKENPLDVKTK